MCHRKCGLPKFVVEYRRLRQGGTKRAGQVMKPSLITTPPTLRRRSRFLSATALVGAGAWDAWPAGLVFLPVVLAPSVAGAATINIPATCVATGPGVCNAQALLASPGAGTDIIAFQGGVLTLDGSGLSYSQKASLGTTPTNMLNQDGHDTTFNGIFSGAGNITITNPAGGGSVTFNAANSYAGSTTVNPGAN